MSVCPHIRSLQPANRSEPNLENLEIPQHSATTLTFYLIPKPHSFKQFRCSWSPLPLFLPTKSSIFANSSTKNVWCTSFSCCIPPFLLSECNVTIDKQVYSNSMNNVHESEFQFLCSSTGHMSQFEWNHKTGKFGCVYGRKHLNNG